MLNLLSESEIPITIVVPPVFILSISIGTYSLSNQWGTGWLTSARSGNSAVLAFV